MADPAALAVSVLALGVSGVTAWLTLFRKGAVRMTQPTVIFFGQESAKGRMKPKVYLRTLLFSTSKRGRILESMHVSLARSEAKQNFNIWVHGDGKDLMRGSGLFVGENGVSANHHFLLPEDANFEWLPGRYQLTVNARLLGDTADTVLFTQGLEVSREASERLVDASAGLYFDWGPDAGQYHTHVDERPMTSLAAPSGPKAPI